MVNEYELCNPSDPYTFKAADWEVAALTVFCISTAYGANHNGGKEDVPVFIFGGAEEWYKETFGRTADEGLEARKEEVAAALASMVLGGFEDRRRYEAALSAITDNEKREKFIEEWQDGRTSMNDIGTYCHTMAKRLLRQQSKGGEKVG